jgi:hypothetical protein
MHLLMVAGVMFLSTVLSAALSYALWLFLSSSPSLSPLERAAWIALCVLAVFALLAGATYWTSPPRNLPRRGLCKYARRLLHEATVRHGQLPEESAYVMIRDGDGAELRTDDPSEALKRAKLLVVGREGVGKTWFLRRLARSQAQDLLKSRASRIPVLLTLRELNDKELLDVLVAELQPSFRRDIRTATRVALESGRFAILADGLDEVPQPARPYVLGWLGRCLSSANATQVIVSARSPIALDDATASACPLPVDLSLPLASLEDLTDAENEEYFKRALGVEKGGSSWNAQTGEVRQLCRTRLWRFLIIRTLQVDGPRRDSHGSLYRDVISQTYRTWYESKGMQPPVVESGFLRRAALLAFEAVESPLTQDAATRILDNADSGGLPAQQFLELLRDTGLVELVSSRVRFVHVSLRDYLAAYHISQIAGLDALVSAVTERAGKREWSGCMCFLLYHLSADPRVLSQTAKILMRDNLALFIRAVDQECRTVGLGESPGTMAQWYSDEFGAALSALVDAAPFVVAGFGLKRGDRVATTTWYAEDLSDAVISFGRHAGGPTNRIAASKGELPRDSTTSFTPIGDVSPYRLAIEHWRDAISRALSGHALLADPILRSELLLCDVDTVLRQLHDVRAAETLSSDEARALLRAHGFASERGLGLLEASGQSWQVAALPGPDRHGESWIPAMYSSTRMGELAAHALQLALQSYCAIVEVEFPALLSVLNLYRQLPVSVEIRLRDMTQSPPGTHLPPASYTTAQVTYRPADDVTRIRVLSEEATPSAPVAHEIFEMLRDCGRAGETCRLVLYGLYDATSFTRLGGHPALHRLVYNWIAADLSVLSGEPIGPPTDWW